MEPTCPRRPSSLTSLDSHPPDRREVTAGAGGLALGRGGPPLCRLGAGSSRHCCPAPGTQRHLPAARGRPARAGARGSQLAPADRAVLMVGACEMGRTPEGGGVLRSALAPGVSGQQGRPRLQEGQYTDVRAVTPGSLGPRVTLRGSCLRPQREPQLRERVRPGPTEGAG
ncbi:unnamed protein product [Rangifer tarandus platyrhynchus]|uniref:Uncharacterized protein n=2 Tax=Rangifer tarandus platyrhynchus TaxID=3082113 RepID=A0ACB0DZI4_RANTA|nr:unnamed protein product [Rangifer tarandus platyrhynchus]CAI9693652.1 unnamed protein product [Rangifer tarandus platyrhynchus]